MPKQMIFGREKPPATQPACPKCGAALFVELTVGDRATCQYCGEEFDYRHAWSDATPPVAGLP
jgi:hypothetical protein